MSESFHTQHLKRVYVFSFQPFPRLVGLPGAGTAMNCQALLEGFFLPPGMYITVCRTAMGFNRVFRIYIHFLALIQEFFPL